ncbi:pyridoxal phosphate-dependent transferase [Lipomyces oligophaga]|uniref:pyridoxal phosphate-dependent transferase n=1 Tax=Lipomyces oligophaga TaxID=45792 RepID=UPI0034CF1C20
MSGLSRYLIRGKALPIKQTVETHPDPSETSKSSGFLKTYEPYCMVTYARPSIVFTHGKGSYLYDLENRKYLDFTAGIAVSAIGHADEEYAELLRDQGLKTIHTSNLYYNEWTGPLSKLLVERTTGSLDGGMRGAARVFVGNSGSEANEGALKFARKYAKKRYGFDTEKVEYVSFHRSFHGRTFGSLSATPTEKYQKPFGPMVPGFKYATFNDIESVNALVTEKTCAVIVEPIQGEGGVYPATYEFLASLRAKCDEVDALLIFDEIQSGLSRTGRIWGHEAITPSDSVDPSSSIVQPDMITIAKALGGGFPIGAIMVTEKVAQAITVGDHGTTFGGNPLASRLAHYVVDKITAPDFLDAIKKKSELFRAGLSQIQEKYPSVVTEIRGTGLMWGIEVKTDPTPIVDAARHRGLLVITAGTNTLRIVPPLVIKEEEILDGLAILDSSIASVHA